MNLIRGQCLICKQKEQVLKPTEVRPFLKYIINTYFVNNKIGVKELKHRISPKSLCVVCACNVETSFKFKKTYEDKVNKESVAKKTITCCLVCGFRGFGLVKTEESPNDFEENVCLFMKTISKSRLYKQCAVCFVCVLELQNFTKIYAVLQEEMELNSKIEEIAISEDRDLEMAPFIKNIPKQQHSTPKKTKLNSKRKRNDSSSDKEMPPSKLPKIYSSKQHFNNSPDVKSVKSLSKTLKIKIPRAVIGDKNMYISLPFVKIEKEKSDTFKIKTPSKKINTVNHEDTGKSANIVSNSTPTESFDYHKPKVSIRIKLISKKRNSRPCPKSKKNLNKCKECNQVFNSLCELKSHLLWHEKPAIVRVNLKRDKVISELIMKSQKEVEQDVEVDKKVDEEKDVEGDKKVDDEKDVEGDKKVDDEKDVKVDKKVDKEIQEEKEKELVEDSQELVQILDNEDVMDTTFSIKDSMEVDNTQEEINDTTDKSEDKVDQEGENSSKEKENEEFDKNSSTPDILEELDDKDEYVVIDDLTDDSDKNNTGNQEGEKDHTEDENETEEIVRQQDQIENKASVESVEEDDGEKNKENREVEETIEKNNKEQKTSASNHSNSEEASEEYHDADDINLILSETDKNLDKHCNKDSSEEENHVDTEESEEQTEKEQEWQEKSSEDISDEDNIKVKELESTIEKKLRLILGEENEQTEDGKEDSVWDEACSEKQLFDFTKLNNTILKKTTMKSDESPKTTKKVRFIVDNDNVEEESNANNKAPEAAVNNKAPDAKDVELLLSEDVNFNQ